MLNIHAKVGRTSMLKWMNVNAKVRLLYCNVHLVSNSAHEM
jgi:hypothetical protein